MERTISGMMGKGSINHNTRAFNTKNVDPERSIYNVQFCNTSIKKVYHELFDEALERYNAKQKRSDRKIDNYYEKIRQSKQEKLFHEVILQIGNKDDMNSKSKEGELAKEILIDYMQDFQKRNPNLYVFSAHLHMDEETPHIHIDFVPFIRNSKRGLDTRVSLKGALAELSAESDWLKEQTEILSEDKEKLLSENENLESRQKKLQREINKMVQSKETMERNIHTYDEDEKWQLPEPGTLMSAKAYRDKKALPLVQKLKELVKNLTLKCIQLTEQVKKLTVKVDRQQNQISRLTDKAMEQNDMIERLQEKVSDLGHLERYFGKERVQAIVEQSKTIEQAERAEKRPKRAYDMGR